MATTEVLLLNGERYEVEGDPQTVEGTIIAAARGSIMALAWLTDSTTGKPMAVNPDHVLALREAE